MGEGDRGGGWQKGAAIIICVAAGIFGTWIFVRYAWGIALPFFLAWLLSRVVRPLVDRLCGPASIRSTGRAHTADRADTTASAENFGRGSRGGTTIGSADGSPHAAYTASASATRTSDAGKIAARTASGQSRVERDPFASFDPQADPPLRDSTDPATGGTDRKRRRLPRSVVAAGLVILLAGGSVLLAVQGIRRGIGELARLVSEVAADRDGILGAVSTLLDRAKSLSQHIPFLRHFEDTPGYAAFCEWLDDLVAGGIDRLVGMVGDRLPGAAMAVAGWLPGAFVFVTVLLLACYYFTADNGAIGASVGRLADRVLPESVRDALPRFGRRVRRLGRQYIRAYLLLGLFTFLEVFIGLSVLGVKYAFLLAWLIALVDFLPLLGTGVVLVPWGIISLLLGEYRVGVGLLILYGLCTLLRQILEPKLLGRGLGLHPLLSLLSMYGGLRLFGIWGMLLAPLGVACVRSVLFEDG